VLAPDGRTVASCGAVFGVDTGRYREAAPSGLLAFLPGDRALVDAYDTGGLTVAGRDPHDRVSDAGGRPRLVAIAADGARVVSFEEAPKGRLLVVRELPTLKRVRTTTLGEGPTARAVGFLADGREAVLAAPPCSQAPCGDAALFTVEQGALVALVPGLTTGAIGDRGDVAAVVRKDGSAALVSLPDGRALAPLPSPGKDVEVDAIAVSPAGDRVAFAVEGKLTALERSGDGFVEILSDARKSTSSLRFAADGRTLFAGSDLAAYREGATPQALPPPLPYDVTLPEGFVALTRHGDEWRVGDSKDHTWMAPEQMQAKFFNEKLGATVSVSRMPSGVLDPSGDAETWGLRAASRSFPSVPLGTAKERAKAGFRVWGDAQEGRSVEVHWVAEGCDDVDNYQRLTERDGGIYVVELEVLGLLGPRRIKPWLHAFFDEPLGPSPARATPPHRSHELAKGAGHKPKHRKH